MSTEPSTVPASLDERQQWLEKRKMGLGGSDAPIILGLSPWKSPYALWAEKTGLVSASEDAENEDMEWGTILEEPIALKYSHVTGRTLSDYGRHAIQYSLRYPWMHCTIDRIIKSTNERGPGDLSIKNTNAFALKEWEEEPPLAYQVQLQHELIVTEMVWGSFAVLIGGNRFRWCDVDRNDNFGSYLIEKEEEFWDLVKRGDPPRVDASDSTKEVLLRLYPKDTGKSVELPPEAEKWIERRRTLKELQKATIADIQYVENQIKAAIGEATIGLLPDGSGMSWKHQHREGYSVEPTDFRTLWEIKADGKRRKR